MFVFNCIMFDRRKHKISSPIEIKEALSKSHYLHTESKSKCFLLLLVFTVVWLVDEAPYSLIMSIL